MFVQLNSEGFRQDELTIEPAERTTVREQRRVSENSLGSSFLNDAVSKPFSSIMILSIISCGESPSSISFLVGIVPVL
ncbi:MAG TPA: palindromic element RPE3 domain-containing protein [Rickettsia endosymbiont of Pyrocoelia pectoralis]|nr:palindromic element RPE3 domain-containing protein [Rickettsia endosymbiont of Pyrocoelia pectoralis]